RSRRRHASGFRWWDSGSPRRRLVPAVQLNLICRSILPPPIRRRPAVASFLALAIIASSAAAGADVPAATPSPVEWRWRSTSAWEYAATAVALGTGFYLRFGASPREANWTGGILFDDALHDRIAVRN